MTSTKRGGRRKNAPSISPARAIAAAGVIAAVVGLLFTAQTLAGFSPLIALNTEAQGRSLSVWVTDVEMLEHEHSDQGESDHDHEDDDTADDPTTSVDTQNIGDQGFAMAPSMSPGTPEDGFQRLQIELDVMNRGANRAAIEPQDFVLSGGDDLTWPAIRGGTFTRVELGSTQVLNTVLAFDIPASVSQDELELVWIDDGGDVRFSLGGNAGHAHG